MYFLKAIAALLMIFGLLGLREASRWTTEDDYRLFDYAVGGVLFLSGWCIWRCF